MRNGKPAKAWRQVGYLVPLHAQQTSAVPAQGLYRGLSEFEEPAGQIAEIALGFTAADIHDCGPSVLAYAETQQAADHIAGAFLSRVNRAESAFDCALLPA